MWNLIKMELYKMFRMRSFWVILLCAISFIGVTMYFTIAEVHQTVTTSESRKSEEGQKETAEPSKEKLQVQKNTVSDAVDVGMHVQQNTQETKDYQFGIHEDNSNLTSQNLNILTIFAKHLSSGMFGMFMIIFSILFITADRKNGYIKNIGGQVRSKWHLVIAQWAAMALYTLLFELVMFLVLAGIQLAMQHKISLGIAKETILFIVVQILLQYILILVCMTLAMVLRSRAFSMTSAVCISMGMGTLVCGGLDVVIWKVAGWKVSLEKYLISSAISRMSDPIMKAQLQNFLLLAAIYFIVMTGISILNTEKRDLV